MFYQILIQLLLNISLEYQFKKRIEYNFLKIVLPKIFMKLCFHLKPLYIPWNADILVSAHIVLFGCLRFSCIAKSHSKYIFYLCRRIVKLKIHLLRYLRNVSLQHLSEILYITVSLS